jgi:hypothetical protein
MALKNVAGGALITVLAIAAIFQWPELITALAILFTAISCWLILKGQKKVAIVIFSIATFGSLASAFGTFVSEEESRSSNTDMSLRSLIITHCPPHAKWLGGEILASCHLEQQGALAKLTFDSFGAVHFGPFTSLAIAPATQQAPFAGKCDEAVQKLWEACPEVAEVLTENK